ncbi:Predicted component of the ribosome quality control (RQC) complex, YloA/Tae2 family, contains fibronectin-binding (FbpA) and DUF814 domains [Humidesulfovibrio mexicanus]|uniref:Predicted component of the ribosome quality control (RQC) complex, YloA/Tae2 family, contains fibronectin-binding (FbpA) and DUF814 domains n=1 Tax=Humidesulfovibrio mexicanus TaxID=147047 RepID=A0A238XY80_9BACT|nr:NFACT RNA binding domain-containing protein [Humidesulfovibrio mexicanus]SNR63393.1 Predicted component of the ribosome quality control (RQC) complex, YloA/Tae2 family, contains fibronectin-binding (FbpA) and DUF814 domains [Humidesulfovibrio mexicanus]
MEANFFRVLADELTAELIGLRIEKIHAPAEDVLVLALHGHGRSRRLCFRPGRTGGLLFLSEQRPTNPAQASARVMWLRKRLVGRRLLASQSDWPALRLAFALTPRDLPQAGGWLVFDLRAGLTLEEGFPCPPEPLWPDLATALDDVEVWRAFPQLTPPLRRRLAALAAGDPIAANALLERLTQARPEGFFLPAEGEPCVWPGEQCGPSCATALEAARIHGERTLFSQLARAEEKDGRELAAQAKRRLERQLAQLEQDRARHARLAALAVAAEALQIALSGLEARPGCERVELPHPTQGQVEVPLDGRLSPAENMARLFRLAAKGRRGLEHVERRRALLVSGAGLETSSTKPTGAGSSSPSVAPVLPMRYKGLSVACFRTTDGFLVLRGKSSQANHEMLSRAASPHDYWLHAAGGPSAHVILRRDYPDQDVPERSLAEAATLCALKSWRKDDAKAEVLLAKVKDVRKVKGAAMGSVAVDQVERTLLVPLDPALEERLAVTLPVLEAIHPAPFSSGGAAVGRGASKRQRKDKR